MNAILSLCHFCELHGPKVVINTQAFRDPPPLSCFRVDSNEVFERNKDLKIQGSGSTWKYGRVEREQAYKNMPTFAIDTCPACRSFIDNESMILSNDDEQCVTYVSSQFPLQEDLFALLRQAGIRSLSCEVYSEREGPIYFGDPSRGHVISFSFFLKDVQARGFLRRYSLLVMMADKMFLLNSWPFFISCFQDIKRYLQELASKVYSEEEARVHSSLDIVPNVVNESTKRTRDAGNPRALTQLVGDEDVWETLHKKFTWVLKAGGMRLQEKLVEGSPLLISDVDQNRMSLLSLMRMMSMEHFQKLLHHIYIGNRISIDSSNEEFLNELPLILKPILFEFQRFNYDYLGGGFPEVSNIALFWNASCATVPSVSSDVCAKFSFQIKDSEDVVRDIKNNYTCDSYHVQLFESNPLNCRPPQIVTKILSLLQESKFSASLLNLYFATLLDEWLSKVKIWSNIGNFPRPVPSSPVEKSIDQRHVPASTSSSILISGDNRSNSKPDSVLNLLLTAVGALECDIPMLNAMTSLYRRSNR